MPDFYGTLVSEKFEFYDDFNVSPLINHRDYALGTDMYKGWGWSPTWYQWPTNYQTRNGALVSGQDTGDFPPYNHVSNFHCYYGLSSTPGPWYIEGEFTNLEYTSYASIQLGIAGDYWGIVNFPESETSGLQPSGMHWCIGSSSDGNAYDAGMLGPMDGGPFTLRFEVDSNGGHRGYYNGSMIASTRGRSLVWAGVSIALFWYRSLDNEMNVIGAYSSPRCLWARGTAAFPVPKTAGIQLGRLALG